MTIVTSHMAKNHTVKNRTDTASTTIKRKATVTVNETTDTPKRATERKTSVAGATVVGKTD